MLHSHRPVHATTTPYPPGIRGYFTPTLAYPPPYGRGLASNKKIKEPSFTTLAAELFGDLGLSVMNHLRGESYSLKGTRFLDYEKSLVLEIVKEDKNYEILLRRL